MERRNFLKLALGIGCLAATGAALRVTEAEAAPLLPSSVTTDKASSAGDRDVQHAVTSSEEAERIAPDQVRWGHHGHGHGHWHHGHGHHWGWHHRRHWGWRHRHWGWRHHHRHWHRRHYW